jgi:hypothetical protein
VSKELSPDPFAASVTARVRAGLCQADSAPRGPQGFLRYTPETADEYFDCAFHASHRVHWQVYRLRLPTTCRENMSRKPLLPALPTARVSANYCACGRQIVLSYQRRHMAAKGIMDIHLQDTSHGPVYLQLRQQIEAHIQGRQFVSGAQLPAPGALAQRLGVDKGEVQRAYFELEQTGLIAKKVGKDFLGQEKISYSVR